MQSISLIFLTGLQAQDGSAYDKIAQYQSNKSVRFGFDTYFNDQPLEDQKNIVVCSAFNGWLYAAYSYFDHNLQEAAATILRSKDNGVTWSVILNGTVGWSRTSITRLDILACGHDSANLKVFVGYCIYDSITAYQNAFLSRYNGNTGVLEDAILHENARHVKDLALASDNLYPAANSNPFSLGVIFSKDDLENVIVFYSSSNGGISLDKRIEIATSSKYFHKVALSYGRSLSSSSGRYFAAWEEKENLASPTGHIYTAHSEPNFNSPFTQPKLLDSLNFSTANKVRNPVISCQNNAVNNDSSNLTEVVLFEKYNPASNNFNIAGVYNKKASVSDVFYHFDLDSSASNLLKPDIFFNPDDSTFMVTYFDSTNQKLPYLIHDFNMVNPDIWSELSSGYNDNNNLVSPHPKVTMDFSKHTGVNAWIGSRTDGNGAAMFDAPYHVYTGMDMEPGNNEKGLACHVWPNPANGILNIEFDLDREERVILSLKDMTGCRIEILADRTFPKGRQHLTADLSDLPSGGYLVTIRTGSLIQALKVFKVN